MFCLNKTFQRILTRTDLDRFLFYGQKMRRLSTWDTQVGIISLIDCSVFRMLSITLDQFYPNRVVMRQLREFSFQFIQHGSLWEVIPYLSASLQTINMEIMTGIHSLPAMTFLSAVALKSPFIKDITIDGSSSDRSNTTPISSSFPCGFRHLSTFDCDFPIHYNTIGHLAHLPNLRDVSLHFSGTNANHASLPAMPAQPFPSLRHLLLIGTHFTSAIEFIQTFLPSVSLQSIKVIAENPPSAGELYQFFSALSSRICLSALTSVLLDYDPGEEYRAGPVLESSDFEPLLRFNNLEYLQLNAAFSPEHISDSLLEAMSFAWPQLTNFGLYSTLFPRPLPQCTFDGLLHFAKWCPRLASLDMLFTASSKIDWNDRSRVVPVNRNLKYLTVGTSPIGDIGMVVSLLSDVFPNIAQITVWDDDDHVGDGFGENYQRWQEVINQYMEKRPSRTEVGSL